MRSMEVVTALLATVMCLTIGWMFGVEFGVSSVEADCRIAGVFRVKNEASACHLISAGKEEE